MGVINRTYRSHYKIGPNGVLEEKKSFETEQEALKMARFLNTRDNIIHKMVAYKCVKCGKWHVGSNNTVLDEAERKKNKEKLRKNLGY